MLFRTTIRPALAGLLFLSGVGVAAPVQAPRLAVLSGIEQGQWTLHEVGSTGSSRALCVSDPAVLLQLSHGGAQCSRFVIADSPTSATVHYTCPGAGHGRTTITVETAQVFRLQTQGIVNGQPFDFDYEGRRSGNCATANVRR